MWKAISGKSHHSSIIGRNSKYERRTADVGRDCENEIIVVGHALMPRFRREITRNLFSPTQVTRDLSNVYIVCTNEK